MLTFLRCRLAAQCVVTWAASRVCMVMASLMAHSSVLCHLFFFEIESTLSFWFCFINYCTCFCSHYKSPGFDAWHKQGVICRSALSPGISAPSSPDSSEFGPSSSDLSTLVKRASKVDLLYMFHLQQVAAIADSCHDYYLRYTTTTTHTTTNATRFTNTTSTTAPPTGAGGHHIHVNNQSDISNKCRLMHLKSLFNLFICNEQKSL